MTILRTIFYDAGKELLRCPAKRASRFRLIRVVPYPKQRSEKLSQKLSELLYDGYEII